MKLSIFTPTNNPQHLDETYDSLRLQNHTDFEWVIVPNEGVKPEQISARIRNDKRTVIKPYEHKNIGALKRYACDQATGEAFIELDHDDLLVPGALKRINQAFESGAGFVYSDVGCFEKKGEDISTFGYDPSSGWEHYKFRVYNRVFTGTRTFPLDARMICEVHYAPDHVRSWSRKAYYAAGGHDATLLVADDHDLICRTYLNQAEFKHTGHCEYLYRFHQSNSVKRYNADIQKLQAANRNKYLHRLVDEWLRRSGAGYLDLREIDPNKPMPQADNSLGCIRAYNILHQVPTARLGFVLSELYRILQPGGWLCLKCPSTDGRGGYMPECQSFWNEEVVRCLYDKDFAKQLRTYQYRFQRVRCWTEAPSQESIERGLKFVFADLVAFKGQRAPGRCRI